MSPRRADHPKNVQPLEAPLPSWAKAPEKKRRMTSRERGQMARQREADRAAREVLAPVRSMVLSARERHAAGMRFCPSWLRAQVLERDGHRCRYCRAKVTMQTANIDHVVPHPEGLTVLSNLVSACQPCNHAKGTARRAPLPLSAMR